MFKPFELKNSIECPGIGTITDEQVYQTVVKHSRVIDRLNPRKWVEMTLQAQCVLMGAIEPDTANPNWKFYGKKRTYYK